MRTVQREIVGAFIFSKDNRILLGKTGAYASSWCIPGGGIEEGESYRQALNREILEETGIDISEMTIEKVEGEIADTSEKTLRDTKERVLVEMSFYNYAVSLSTPASEVKLKLEDDFTEARWFTASEIKNIRLASPTEIKLIQLGYIAK